MKLSDQKANVAEFVFLASSPKKGEPKKALAFLWMFGTVKMEKKCTRHKFTIQDDSRAQPSQHIRIECHNIAQCSCYCCSVTMFDVCWSVRFVRFKADCYPFEYSSQQNRSPAG